MTSTEIASASKIMLGSTEATAMYIGSTLIWQAGPKMHNGHEYVEIGGVKWATTNLGASSRTDTGLYFQWGDTQGYTASQAGSGSGQKYFGWEDYKYGNGTSSPGTIGLTKYNSTDGKTVLDISDDAAQALWGGCWRMPTVAELQSLQNAYKVFHRENNVWGCFFHNYNEYPNGIFLPYCGYCNGGGTTNSTTANYWANSLDTIYYANGLYMGSSSSVSSVTLDSFLRFQGLTIRPVYDPSLYQANGLPTGWTELEYISSTSSGSQYINLGVKLYETLGTNYDIAMKFNLIGNGSDATLPTMFNCQNLTNPWPGTFVRRSNNNVTGRYIGGSNKDNTLGTINQLIELPVLTSPNKNVYNLNNGGLTHTFGTSLFCAFKDNSNTPFRFCEAKLYYFKLWVEGTLVRDLIPCKDTNNTVGMYDIVNHVFYTSPNGAAFVAGPTV